MKNPPTSKAPFDWNELLSEMEKVQSPTGNGSTVQEIADVLHIGHARASKIVRHGLENGKIERVQDLRMTNTGYMKRFTTFRFKGKK
jgi:predicted transcriptional regulator